MAGFRYFLTDGTRTVKYYYYRYGRKLLRLNYIRQAGESVLREKAAAVDPTAIVSTDVKKLIDRMIKTMRSHGDLGIAAPQLGRPLRIITLEITKRHLSYLQAQYRNVVQRDTVPLQVLINPQLKVLDNHKVAEYESCSSIHNCMAKVPRYTTVEVSALDRHGNRINYIADGWLSRILQHEVDHLDGLLYVDKMLSKTFAKV
ncbi:uncharacterized protein TRIADDRAFT_55505 [Trichoplax adhaerens]|uniref:Peptide deformylase n=1 Tax=Trichoplax adhaerens TaxID=10228 RepID=B3RV29_TRIAD|nr:hypothetical protein TRIADDRAFT_55505 [Trichoplax adhaerens]EDV25924.1 hypothetical protein TRIADDRAFT_55505 [Trichoplax adhaerens]|eukprot:XP_002111957.1 hypothetical protein TRIADDRAFT_55505 [Trichoplax adhaerens]